jgi:hypothetical protein
MGILDGGWDGRRWDMSGAPGRLIWFAMNRMAVIDSAMATAQAAVI